MARRGRYVSENGFSVARAQCMKMPASLMFPGGYKVGAESDPRIQRGAIVVGPVTGIRSLERVQSEPN